MRFYSTGNKGKTTRLRRAILGGLAPDGGLYLPQIIPQVSRQFLDKLHTLTFPQIAFELSRLLFNDEIPADILKKITEKAFNFPIKLVQLDSNLFSLELFHGPSLSFKDFGARFMAQLLSYFASQEKKDITILVATSGDTGSAVGYGFHKIPGIRVVLLYPKNMVSFIQKQQLTTINDNVQAIEVRGTFDDCQQMIKQAFLDKDLRNKLFLTSANSINVARLLPQIFYYFYAFSRLKSQKPIKFSIPCGNLGNLTAGILAKKMGLPITKIVAATNSNDVFTRFLKNGTFKPQAIKQTLSNAMDVGNPNNLARIRQLYKNDIKAMQKDIESQSFTDEQVKDTIKEVYQKYNYILDPHSAVAYLGLKGHQGVFLSTAHPAKFPELIEKVLGKKILMPKSLKTSLKRKKETIELSKNFDQLKHLLLNS